VLFPLEVEDHKELGWTFKVPANSYPANSDVEICSDYFANSHLWNFAMPAALVAQFKLPTEATMGIGKGALLWLLGIPIPIIILLVLFWR
jgi:hypothetical protein